ncbi:amidase [Yinghuangia aomiensis]|uniref:Amidase n=1 Tax=Yinghuangia aomiensis TaxID=676205 RepID=A0ABP9HUI1_9ACTN
MLTPDPLAVGGLPRFAERFRAGETTSEAATRAYLERIRALDGRLGSYQYVASDQALAAAREIDALFAAGTYLGPLMGVPVSVKDLFVVDGMPTTAGSLVDVTDLVSIEGSFVRRLREAGCVLLGKTKTVEFGLGITGLSEPHGTPRNPWDERTPRLPGGSSSGAGVAVAAGLCAFAVGADTGGSVRVPAALCGVFGLKTSFGVWPGDGVFPLAPHLDSVGLLTASAEDAALVFAHLTAGREIAPALLSGLRLGVLDGYFRTGLDDDVRRVLDAAVEALAGAGASVETVELPEAPEREAYFPVVLPACLVGSLGPRRVLRDHRLMDPVVAARTLDGLDVRPEQTRALEARRRAAMRSAAAGFAGWDGWLSATTTTTAPAVMDAADPGHGLSLAMTMTRNTQPVNYLGLCAVSVPLPRERAALPLGMQLIGPGGSDARLLSVALAVEGVLGRAPKPDLHGFT